MSASGIFILIALSVGILTFIGWPFIARAGDSAASDRPELLTDSRLPGVERDYQTLLLNTRDLDFDFQTGKLTAEDYRQQREALTMEGALLLKQLETLRGTALETSVAYRKGNLNPQFIDSQIEKAVVERRKNSDSA